MTGTLDQTAVFSTTPRVLDLQTRLRAFMDEHIFPNEAEFARQVNAATAGSTFSLSKTSSRKRVRPGSGTSFCRVRVTPRASSARA